MAARVRRRTSPASSRWAPRSGTARWPASPPSRSRTTRRSSRRACPAITASSTTPGTTAAAASRSSPTRRRPGRRRWTHVAPGVESIHDAVHRSFPGEFSAVGQRALRHRRRLLDVRLLPPRRGAADPVESEGLPHTTERFVRPSKDYSWSSDRRPHGNRAGRRRAERLVPRRDLPAAPVHVRELHPHRLRHARGRALLRDRGRVGARQRRPPRRGPRRRSSAPARSTTARSSSSPTTAWRRTTRPATATGT